ncbi:MAG: glucose-1-phosphate cytidylyltransferase [Clostridium beijerinckii]|jgi:glucose-1-phosphate cytidylyltransferase|uniref:glucose-1-phosphate cytidylyltransferase n=1 Tax=Clostridium beijerinckii TaxID=1520 RepID=UPI001494A108|nr:glucose-1-phosphate cytidylyltransferase [Clostridium beijerinckii]MCI1477724.1 glucose-1-phosphate cytidylyltransferase [Clostridium beijerinckii]MCI1577960.1 glucose-1-phosphate cytidylyltransferase [Clostridium beijerinckii]MCI1583141.1 glucose-1-phosphate cytidylyltransferase [Clostridium beijerinckii]MCI1620629.1 glucose-1-phosphate cytidylyltransferase [Clostridium beijerinckii]NOW87866.1 glucose-1-phosphate cytidylyltransferase [Clostridium beijerinckii]
MKVVILAGGYGTRISEESHLKPKPMIEIGGNPILWHIMKCYSNYGFNEFIICCGYKGYMIKEYFADYYLHRSDITFDFTNSNKMIVHNNVAEPWKVTLIDTGLDTMTGGRLKRVREYIGNEAFMLTYGDGVSDVDIHKLLEFHNESEKIATLTAIQPGGRFGVLDINERDEINSFTEKSKEDGGWINGGYMVLEPEIFEYIDGDDTILERKPLESLAMQGRLSAYKHKGFWQCMDTQRDKELLERLWRENNAKWKVWK